MVSIEAICQYIYRDHKQGGKLANCTPPQSNGLKLNINENDNRLDVNLALEVAPYFQVQAKEAQETIAAFEQKIGQWPQLADNLGLSRTERERMAPAFRGV